MTTDKNKLSNTDKHLKFHPLKTLSKRIHYKKCSKCKQVFPRTIEFFRWRSDRNEFRASCRFCDKQHYKDNRKTYLARNNRWHLNFKKKILRHYSPDLKCQMCGFDDIRALSLDHIDGGGNEHRRQIDVHSGAMFYRWIRDNNFPEGYQVLCMNCQFIKKKTHKEFYGGNDID